MTLLIFGVILVTAAAAIARFNFWKKEGAKLQQSGYLPPAPPLLGRLVFRFITRLARFVMIGPVKVIGRNNLNYKGRLIIAPNHQFEMDFAMVAAAVPDFHYMTAIEELQGIRGTLGAWTGAYGVDRKQPGEAVIDASTQLLIRQPNSRVLIFPQGKLIAQWKWDKVTPDGKRTPDAKLVHDSYLRPDDFKTGSVRILTKTKALIDGQPAAILPLGIFYKRDCKDATWFHRLLLRAGFKWFRRAFGKSHYGGTIVIGEPIAVESLPSDPREATELVRTKIQAALELACTK